MIHYDHVSTYCACKSVSYLATCDPTVFWDVRSVVKVRRTHILGPIMCQRAFLGPYIVTFLWKRTFWCVPPVTNGAFRGVDFYPATLKPVVNTKLPCLAFTVSGSIHVLTRWKKSFSVCLHIIATNPPSTHWMLKWSLFSLCTLCSAGYVNNNRSTANLTGTQPSSS